jgi:hypothetical protein
VCHLRCRERLVDHGVLSGGKREADLEWVIREAYDGHEGPEGCKDPRHMCSVHRNQRRSL